jgi:hypothetical protein
LRRHVIKIKNLCLEVTKGYSKHYKEINSCPPPEHCLNKIKLLFDQRLECRCAKYNLTKEEEEQWEPSDINSDYNKVSNTNNESKEHDSDEFNIYTTSKGKDENKDDGKENLHIGEKVDMEGAEKLYRLGERILGMKKKVGSHWKKNIAKRRNHPKKSIEPVNFDPATCTAH